MLKDRAAGRFVGATSDRACCRLGEFHQQAETTLSGITITRHVREAGLRARCPVPIETLPLISTRATNELCILSACAFSLCDDGELTRFIISSASFF